MFKKLILLACTVAASLALPSVSLATDAREAIRLCERNPACKFTVRGNGDVYIEMGDVRIDCPQEGPCVCVVCSRPVQKELTLPSAIVIGPKTR